MSALASPKLVHLLTTKTAFEAEAVSQSLRDIGIAAFVKSRVRYDPSRGFGAYTMAGLVEESIFELWVPADHAERALHFLGLPVWTRRQLFAYRAAILAIIVLLVAGIAAWLHLL